MMPEIWQRWAHRFWFLRGVAAAIALSALVPQFTDLSRWEFLRAFAALLVGWNGVVGYLGRLIGQLPFLPNFSADAINALLFTSTVGLPGAFVIAQRLRTSSVGVWVLVPMCASVVIATYVAYVISIAPYNPSYYTLISPDGHQSGPWFESFVVRARQSFPVVCGMLLAVAVSFLGALLFLKGFARGVIVLASFILTLQVLYWLNAPWVGDVIRETANTTLRDHR